MAVHRPRARGWITFAFVAVIVALASCRSTQTRWVNAGGDGTPKDPLGFGAVSPVADYEYAVAHDGPPAPPHCRDEKAFLAKLEGDVREVLMVAPYRDSDVHGESWFGGDGTPGAVRALQIRYSMDVPAAGPADSPVRRYSATVIATKAPYGVGFAVYSSGFAFRANGAVTLPDAAEGRSTWYVKWLSACSRRM